MVEDIVKQVEDFVEERDWKQYHNPKDLAISISLEASELLELFQWKSSEESVKKYPQEMKEELADILIYCIQFASIMGYDIKDIITSKLKSNAAKYPAKLVKGKKEKYTEYTQEVLIDEKR